MTRKAQVIERREVEHFRELNRDLAVGKATVTKAERMAMVHQQFPAVDKLDWERAFDEDYGLLGKLIRDVLRLDVPEPGKSGPRPVLDLEDGTAALHRLLRDDYGTLPFAEMLEVLRGKLSLRGLANKTGISKTQIARLLDGEVQPTVPEMMSVAGAFKKDPSYFLEWRAAAVASAIVLRLSRVPEASISAYRQIKAD